MEGKILMWQKLIPGKLAFIGIFKFNFLFK